MRGWVFTALLTLCTTFLQGEILKVEIDGIIDPITSEFIRSAVAEAGDRDAELLLIELSTPGGLGQSMQEIVQDILNSRVPVVCYVYPRGARAASAGFFILLSADVAAMAPGTNTGAAHPVFPFGSENEKMLEKVINDYLANLRAIVNQRNRNYDLAEKGVRESHSYTASEALEGELIDLVAENEDELLQQLQGREITRFSGEKTVLNTEGQRIVAYEMTFRQRVLSAIADPNLATILGLIGLLGLYLEFVSPGAFVPGVVGGICLLLSLLGFSLLPINLIGILLIILGIGLFIAELQVQGFGLFGMGGIVAMTLGLLILVDAPSPEVRVHLSVALAVAGSFGIIILFLLRLAVKSQLERVTTGATALEGMIGNAQTDIDQGRGKVFVYGELWDAVSEKPIAKGMKVRVLNSKNMVLTVEPLQPGNVPASEQREP